jgi:Rhodopirellula transposase DDE domain
LALRGDWRGFRRETRDRAPLFCHITQSWRVRPLVDRNELIAATTTKAGLKVESALNTATYEKGIKVSNAEMKTLDIQGDAFHPPIRPRSAADRSGQIGWCPNGR